MKNKIPPPIVTLFFGLCIFFSKEYFPQIDNNAMGILSLISFVAGISILVLAVRAFKNQETTVNPILIEKASSLVVSGIFKYSRNPMYLGMVLILLGLSFEFNIIGGFLLIIAFVTFITFFQIKPEEMAMRKIFDQEFVAYKKNVRRWL